MNDRLISDSFAPAAGGLGFTRVRVKSQTERISLLGSRLFQIFSFFYYFYNLLNFYLKIILTICISISTQSDLVAEIALA